MRRRRYNLEDPEPHGRRGLIDCFITNKGAHPLSGGRVLPRTIGRRMLFGWADTCRDCQVADARNARLRKLHTTYRRKRH